MKAVVLAAGEGRRLRPLTNRRPKPMLPIANRPLLEHVVEAVTAAGLDELVLVVGYGRERIQTHFGDGDDWDVTIEYVRQEKQLGTGHAVAQVEGTVDDHFLVLNGDRIIDPAAVERVAAAVDAGDAPALAITRSGRPHAYGVVETAGDDLRSIVEKPRPGAVASDWINAGVYGFGDAIFDAIREAPPTETGEHRLTDAVQSLADAGTVSTVRYEGTWLDVSHLWDLLHVDAAVIEGEGAGGTAASGAGHVGGEVVCGTDVRVGRGAVVEGPASLGDNVTIGPTAHLERVIVMPDATIGAGSVLRDCVVGANATVGPNVTVAGGDADIAVEGRVHEDVTLGGVIGDNAWIGAAAVFESGTIVGDGATVGTGVVADGRIAPDAEVRR